MSRIRIVDAIIIVIFIAVWGFYFSYEGTTRFDVNQTFTLPLLIAAESTALAVLYAVFRYYSHKVKTGKLTLEQLLPKDSEDSPGKESTTKGNPPINNGAQK
ncbi:MAG: hypothetical protein KAJ73_08555 [Zetaproteobacteria bacterium]|nr:hypothetical protein [Zetaproteobacteria bacterium]